MTPREADKMPNFSQAKDANARIHATKDASPRVKEYYETAEIAAVIAQRVADRAKMLDIPEPQHRHIGALENAMSSLREAENQLRLAGMPSEQWEEQTTCVDRDDCFPPIPEHCDNCNEERCPSGCLQRG